VAGKGGLSGLGFIPAVFGTLFGTPSVVSLARATFSLRDLHGPIREIIDAYNDGLAFMGGLVEPLIRPPLAWFGGLFGWEIALNPNWRHLFVLCMVFVLANARSRLQEGRRPWALLDLVPAALGALIGSAIAGTVPWDGGWWAQGLIAALPLTLGWLAWTAANLFGFEIGGRLAQAPARARSLAALGHTARAVGGGVRSVLFQMLMVVPPYFVFGFAAGALLSLIPGLKTSAGIVGLGAFLVFAGAGFLRAGLKQGEPSLVRSGLGILGGFLGAGLIFALDAAFRLWS
jgi:hypothetical protein